MTISTCCFLLLVGGVLYVEEVLWLVEGKVAALTKAEIPRIHLPSANMLQLEEDGCDDSSWSRERYEVSISQASLYRDVCDNDNTTQKTGVG
jgi:hypothetical protein